MPEGPETAARETLEKATKWAELGIEATLGRREDYPQPFARLRLVISAAIEEEREACAKIAENYPGLDSVGYYVAKQIRTRTKGAK